MSQLCFQRFSNYYENLFVNEIEDNEYNSTIERSVYAKREELKDIIYDDSFTHEDVKNAINRLKKNKSSGFDFISNEMLINSKCD